MAKKQAIPILAVKLDFADSLNAFLGQAIILHEAVDSALKHGAVSEEVADLLRERCDAFHDALYGPDEPSGDGE